MATPTNHTTSSIFYFGDMLEPELSQGSLEQNSSIEESNIFISMGGEVSDHSRCDTSSFEGLKARKSHSIDKTNIVSLLPLQEGPEEPENPLVGAAAAVVENNGFGNRISKPSLYSGLQQNRNLEQPELAINTEPTGMMDGNSISGRSIFSEKHPPQAFSPTIHTSNQTSGFSGSNPPQTFSPTVHTSNQTGSLGLHNERDKLSSIEEISTVNIQKIQHGDDQGIERFTTWVIYIAMFFLVVLITTSTFLVFSAIRGYGFVTLVLLTIVVFFCSFLACFVDSTVLSQNTKLRPVSQKIVTVMRATRKILEDEYHLFMRDWKESILLTQGTENYSHDHAENTKSDDSINCSESLQIPPTRQARRKKSKAFKFIRPLLGLRKKLSRGEKRQYGSNSRPISSYKAPAQ